MSDSSITQPRRPLTRRLSDRWITNPPIRPVSAPELVAILEYFTGINNDTKSTQTDEQFTERNTLIGSFGVNKGAEIFAFHVAEGVGAIMEVNRTEIKGQLTIRYIMTCPGTTGLGPLMMEYAANIAPNQDGPTLRLIAANDGLARYYQKAYGFAVIEPANTFSGATMTVALVDADDKWQRPGGDQWALINRGAISILEDMPRFQSPLHQAQNNQRRGCCIVQ